MQENEQDLRKALTQIRRELSALRKLLIGKNEAAKEVPVEEMVSVSAAAGILDLSPTSIRRLIDSGDLAAVRPARKWLIPKSQIAKYVERLGKSHG